MKKITIAILCIILLGCNSIFMGLLDDFEKLGHLTQIDAEKEYHFNAKVNEVSIGWNLIIDPFHPEKRKYLSEKKLRVWKNKGVNTKFDIKLTNRSDKPLDVSEPSPPFSSIILYPGESINYEKIKFVDRTIICNLRNELYDGNGIIKIDLDITFANDIDWKNGIYIGLFWADA